MAWPTHGKTTSPGFPSAPRAVILRRDPYCTCDGCKRCTEHGCARPSTDADHILSPNAGGTDHPSNGRGLCSPCHDHHSAQQGVQARGDGPLRKRPATPHPGAIG